MFAARTQDGFVLFCLASAMDREQCLKLIQLYGEYRRLWDAQSPDYTNRGLREDAWMNINREMNVPIAELKKKMDSLLGSYRKEKSREKKRRMAGSGRGEVYKSNWYAYEAFNFLGDRNDPGSTQNTFNEENASLDEVRNDASHNFQDFVEETLNETRNENSDSTREREQETKEEPHQTSDTRGKKRAKRNVPDDDNIALETKANDPYDVFGKYVANELRKYDAYTLSHVKYAISKIIFEADTGAYQPYTSYYTRFYSRSDSPNSTSRPSISSMPPNSPKPSTSPMPNVIPSPPPNNM